MSTRASTARASGRANPEPGKEPGGATRRRLLDTAERMFAEHGFADTSVRDLTREAGANLAAVNYHFGGKENLYVEVCRRVIVEMRTRRIEAVTAAAEEPGATLEDVLLAFCESFVEPLVDSERGERLMRLYEREMSQSLMPADMFYVEMLQPMLGLMRKVMDRFCPGMSDDQVTLWMHSMVGQLIHTLQCRRDYLELGKTDIVLADLPRVVDHVVKVTALGMRTFSEKGCA